jgi:hypothetical protein
VTAVVKTPRVTVIGFSLQAVTANRRASVSTRLLSGPAVIRSVTWMAAQGATTPQQGLELGVASAPVQEDQVVLSTAKAWAPLGDYIRSALADSTLAGTFFPFFLEAANSGRTHVALGIVVPQTSFYLVLSMGGTVTGAFSSCVGSVVVAEDINPSMYANYF